MLTPLFERTAPAHRWADVATDFSVAESEPLLAWPPPADDADSLLVRLPDVQELDRHGR